MSARFDIRPGFSDTVALPALAGVRLGAVGHFIAILGKKGNLYQIGEPAQGPSELSAEDLVKNYDFTGFFLSVRLPDGPTDPR